MNDEPKESLLIELDPKQKPAAIDLWKEIDGEKRGPIRGIYLLDGDTLKLCYSIKVEGKRPKDFTAEEEIHVLITLKRAKP